VNVDRRTLGERVAALNDQMAEALAAAKAAVGVFDDATRWFEMRAATFTEPLAVEVWIYDEELEHVLLVQHRWRGWVPPGGAVEPDESLAVAACREVYEETGLVVELWNRPAAACVRSYKAEWSDTLGISYATVADRRAPLRPESGQPARWFDLEDRWSSVFAEDRERIREFTRHLRDR
jgi:8-oxo-dGTP pyrophosphatase MutT (NUDIX family)